MSGAVLDKVALGDDIEKMTFEQRFEESKVIDMTWSGE